MFVNERFGSFNWEAYSTWNCAHPSNPTLQSQDALATSPTPGILDIFQFHVRENPHSTAATCSGERLSFLDLDKKSNRLAHYLQKHHPIGPNMPVAIMGSNKIDMCVCQLAILKAGGAFVPLEPDLPPERLEGIKKAKIGLFIACDEESLKVLAGHDDILDLKKSECEIDKMPDGIVPDPGAKPDDLAYILFTSGSTSGIPKGVMQTRRGLIGQIQNYTQNLQITNKDKFLQLASMAHDQAIVDTYGALLNGAELHFVNRADLNDLPALRRLIADRQISIFSSIPSFFALIFGNQPDEGCYPNLRIVTLGGETVKKEHVALYQLIASPNCLFINGYGATECSWISYYIIAKNDSLDQYDQIPLGIIAPQTEAYLDFEVGDNETVGELCIHSDFISSGYWQNAEATKNAFFEKEGKPFYRTGDLAIKDDKDVYHFRGRLCWHEKIDGKRVNLMEVEECMRQRFPLEECVVIAHGAEEKKLYAFYAIKQGAPFNATSREIRSELEKFLKSHEIPSDFVALAKFPLLPNGKINRQELQMMIQSITANRVYDRQSKIHDLDLVDQLLYTILDLDQPPKPNFDYHEHGIASLQVMRFVELMNDSLSRQIPKIQISTGDVYRADNNTRLKKIIEQKKLSAKSLKYEESDVIESFYVEGRGKVSYRDAEIPSLTFGMWGLQTLAEHYNKKYDIKIIPCESHQKFIDLIKKFLLTEKGQLGLTLHRDNNPEAHASACILHVDDQRRGLLFVTDSVGGFPHQIQKQIQQIENLTLCFDPYSRRQTDQHSCALDLISYLKDGLRLNMAAEMTVLEEQKDQNMLLFQNPPDLLKHVQSKGFPKDLTISINPDVPLKLSKKGETLAGFRKRHHQEATYIPCYDLERKFPSISQMDNRSLYKKAKKFKAILQNVDSTSV